VCEDVSPGSKVFMSLALMMQFNAARFFSLDKSALFSILYVLITFVTVMIQFKIKL
jgi:hypothetical protein